MARRRKYKCGKLSAATKRKAITNWKAETGRKSASRGCKLVVFGKRGCRSAIAVERCADKKLSTSAKKRFRAMRRSKEICLKKRGKRYFFSSKRC